MGLLVAKNPFESVCSAHLERIKLAATLAGSVLNLTPVATAMAIVRGRRSAAKVSPVPLLMVAFNGFCWCVYGVVLRSWFPLVAANAVGVVTGVVGLATYRCYAGGRELHLFVALALLVAGAARDAVADPPSVPLTKKALGVFCVAVTVGLFASPLVTLNDVVRSKSTATMSFPMTLASFFCSCFWLCFGLCIDDSFVWFPNVSGLGLSIIQLALFARYRGSGSYLYHHHHHQHHHHQKGLLLPDDDNNNKGSFFERKDSGPSSVAGLLGGGEKSPDSPATKMSSRHRHHSRGAAAMIGDV